MISERSQILASPRCCERYIIPMRVGNVSGEISQKIHVYLHVATFMVKKHTSSQTFQNTKISFQHS